MCITNIAFYFLPMRYHYIKKDFYDVVYGVVYYCDHPIYNRCTLYQIGNKGLAVIQQKFLDKKTYWDCIDDYLVDDIYLNSNFKRYFDKHSDEPRLLLYPTVTVRQIMWALKMKPIKKEYWETMFDHPIL